MISDLDIDRKKRKQKIVAVYGAILVVLSVLVLLWLTPDPTCTDGKKNGIEAGVDCGGLCGPCREERILEPIVVEKTAFVSAGNGTYDAVVWIRNPNETSGGQILEGSFIFLGMGGEVLAEEQVTSFILPRESKYIVQPGVFLGEDASVLSVEWKLDDVTWVDMQEVGSLQLSIVDRKYEELVTGLGFSQVSGLLKNDSTYDWNDVGISIVLFDKAGNLLATHGTSRQTFRSGEKWDFQLIFPIRFPGDVYTMEMQAETNIYHNSNFLKSNPAGGLFQRR